MSQKVGKILRRQSGGTRVVKSKMRRSWKIISQRQRASLRRQSLRGRPMSKIAARKIRNGITRALSDFDQKMGGTLDGWK